MERKIAWSTGCLEEIELVYEKAAKDENAAALLSEYEEMALSEAEKNSWLPLALTGGPLTQESLKLSDPLKEYAICFLGRLGMQEFSPSSQEPVITVTFSDRIQEFLGCTMFSLLNRLEKLDGAYDRVLFPKATLRLQVPLGCRRGLMKFGMLIMRLYPWLSVTETAIGVRGPLAGKPNA